MTMLKKILAPTDFSDLSAAGVRYGCRLAKEDGAEIIVMNVVLLDESNAVDKQQLERHKQRLDEFVGKHIGDDAAPLRMRKLVDVGQPYNAIREFANNESVDLIVMSSHGRSGLSRMLIGSITDKVLRGASCPVLVVPVKTEK